MPPKDTAGDGPSVKRPIPHETYEAAANRLVNTGDSGDHSESQIFATLAVAHQLKRIADSLDELKHRGDFNQREF